MPLYHPRRPPGAPLAPIFPPKAPTKRLFSDPDDIQKSTKFRTLEKSAPGGLTIDPWPPLDRLGVHFVCFWVHFRGRFWSYFEAFSKKLKTLIFDDLTALSKVFHIQKPIIFRCFFGSFLVPISGPPSGRSFWPILADQSADRDSTGRF